MINPTPNPRHQYVKRSCLNCTYFLNQSCHAYAEHQEPFMWSDKARWGCRLYSGEYIGEQSKKDKMRRPK